MKKLLLILAVVGSTVAIGQTKKDLQAQIDRQNKTIDSLRKVVANQENIIENRDRSNRILTEDVTTLKEKLAEEVQLRRDKTAVIQELRKKGATGKARLIYMSNLKNVLKVPEGKYWIMNQFMSDYAASITTDSLGNTIAEEIHVFLKEIDGKVLTDPAKKMYGPKLYSSLHPEQTIKLPIVFTEGMQFKIIVFKGEIGKLYPFEGRVYCTFTERDVGF